MTDPITPLALAEALQEHIAATPHPLFRRVQVLSGADLPPNAEPALLVTTRGGEKWVLPVLPWSLVPEGGTGPVRSDGDAEGG